jgi:hypothetical protein
MSHTDSVREDADTIEFDVTQFPAPNDGLTDYERRRMRESADDQAARRAASAATRGSNTIDQFMAQSRPVPGRRSPRRSSLMVARWNRCAKGFRSRKVNSTPP